MIAPDVVPSSKSFDGVVGCKSISSLIPSLSSKVLLGRKKISLSSGTVIDPDVVRWINKDGLDKLPIGQPLQDVMAVAVDHLVGRWHFGGQHDVDL